MFWQYFVKFTIKNMKTFSCWYCFTMNNEKKNEKKTMKLLLLHDRRTAILNAIFNLSINAYFSFTKQTGLTEDNCS